MVHMAGYDSDLMVYAPNPPNVAIYCIQYGFNCCFSFRILNSEKVM